MGLFSRLFGGGAKKVPSWARDAFGPDVGRFESFVEIVASVLDGAATRDDVRTGSVVLDTREWILHELAEDCAHVDASGWRELVERSLRGGNDEAPDAEPQPVRRARQPPRPWLIGTAAWGGVMFECGEQAVVVVLLPTIDTTPAPVPAFPAGLVQHVIVCNHGTAGHLAPAAVAQAAGLTRVYAIEPSRIAGIDAEPLGELVAGPLQIMRAGSGVFGRWDDGATFLCGDAIPISMVADRKPRHVIGQIVFDAVPDASLDWRRMLERTLIVANVPGIEADEAAAMLLALGIPSQIVHRPASLHEQVLALVIAGQLAEADALAARAIAAGEQVAEMQFERAMIALLGRDERGAETLLSGIDTPHAWSSRAALAARHKDPAAKQLAMRAVDALPGDAIAIQVAIQVHGLLADHATARALLAEHGAHLDTETRVRFELALESGRFELGPHRFPQHAQLALEGARPLVEADQFAEAEPLLRRAHELDPGDAAITAELGFALSRQHRDHDAIALYDAAIARGGAGALLRFNRGNCHLRMQRYADAVTDFRACVEIKPDWHDARVNLISALLASSDRVGAIHELAQLEALGGSPQHVAALAQMLAR